VEFLSQFQFILEFVSGNKNYLSDTLSRPLQVNIADNPSFVDIGNINSKVKIFSLLLTRNQMVYKVHCDTKWSHPGIKGTIFACKKELDFKVSRSFVKDIVMRCERCQRFKSDRCKNKPFFREFVSPKEVGQEISIDIAGPFEYDSHRYWLIVLVDRLSRFVWTHLIDHTPSANELFVYLHDTMKTSRGEITSVLSDNGP
jgi:Integrase zinc binding domain